MQRRAPRGPGARGLRLPGQILFPSRLRGGFKKLDPRRIPPDKIEEAASLSRGHRWSEEVALAEMPELTLAQLIAGAECEDRADAHAKFLEGELPVAHQ